MQCTLYSVQYARVCLMSKYLLSSSLAFIIGWLWHWLAFRLLTMYGCMVSFCAYFPCGTHQLLAYSRAHSTGTHKRNIDFTFGLLVRGSAQKRTSNSIMWL